MTTKLENLWLDLECAINSEDGIEKAQEALDAAIRSEAIQSFARGLTEGEKIACRLCVDGRVMRDRDGTVRRDKEGVAFFECTLAEPCLIRQAANLDGKR